ncbi:MAG: hypothetical protein NC201_00560 [Prevotella sp.]|nr:hypothetical protein [Bacteroides sp.]MCM1365719.1 hypothetical protein [Prevotella sp.]MCM1436389.1 hypothetical protein [Prevotella sp.]
MNHIQIPLDLKKFEKHSPDHKVIEDAMGCHNTIEALMNEERYIDALERVVESLRTLRDFSDYENTEFRAMLVSLLFDLSEIHFALKDFKQSEKELEVLFKVLDNLIATDPDRFGKYHILAMELSTRILRSRKKAMELLVKHQITAGTLYEKVNSGVLAATDKLVDSLHNVGKLLASSGDYKAATKFYAEAIKFSKKRSGRVTRKEVKMTIEMAEVMIRVKAMRPRARRLLNAILPHAIALETIQLEEDTLALIEIIDADILHEPKWKGFVHNLTVSAKKRLKSGEKEAKEERVADLLKEEVESNTAKAVLKVEQKLEKKLSAREKKRIERLERDKLVKAEEEVEKEVIRDAVTDAIVDRELQRSKDKKKKK